jgi:AcrR family transcriptional regulator
MKKDQGFQRRKPRQARSLATVDSILEAAAQVLQRAGHDGFNTNAVAERAGVSVGTLYQYFPDKDAILVAVARREMTKSEMPREKSMSNVLVAALVRALENLLGSGRTAGVMRSRRVPIKSDVRRMLFHVEDVLLSWVPLPMQPVRVQKRVR